MTCTYDKYNCVCLLIHYQWKTKPLNFKSTELMMPVNKDECIRSLVLSQYEEMLIK